ncbi:MAG TPA: PAS domain S-box protein [Pyrinomonadaceae bacterium]|nr:PAS domain S-box protein [Pyrinomonadaceae bacterium]
MSSQSSAEKSSFARLASINRAITTSLSFNEVLNLIVTNAAELFSAETTMVLLTDERGTLRVEAALGLDSEKVRDFSGRMEESVIRDLSNRIGTGKNLVGAPVVVNGSLDGFLAIVREAELTPDQHWQFSALADQAAIALNNARLHELQTREALRQRDESVAALRESEREVNILLDSITDLFYHLDQEFRFTDINSRAEEVMGKQQADVLGKVIWDVFPQSRNTLFRAQLEAAMNDQMAVHFETESRSAGSWFEVHAYPSNNGLFVYLRDVTERKHSELATRHLAAIVESSDDAIISKDLNGIITGWNSAAERIFGYTTEEAIGRSITMLIPAHLLDEETKILEQIRKGGRISDFESIRVGKDGRLVDISLTVSPIRDEDGRIIGASKIARDITERKLAEQEIRFQAHLLNVVEQAVIATDLEGKIQYWNSYAEWLYGWSAEEAIGSNILDLTPAPAALDKANEVLIVLRRGDSWSGEFLVRRKDGTSFPALVTDSPIFENGDLIGIVGVSVDISERKRGEEERNKLLASEREAREEAEKANNLKDEFLATLSHELRNPLNVILGYSEVLLRSDEARNSPFLQRAAEILKRNAQSQSQLVRDLLDLSRLHTGKLSLNREAVSLPAIISNAVETVRSETAAKNVKLRVLASDTVLFVDADPLRLEQVIWNLLNNAVKFTPADGEVVIGFEAHKEEACLFVEDNGQGIDPDFMPHVFEMFRQADATSSRSHAGLGIGLALVQQLIGLHGGRVAVASEGRGKGTKFTITIPLSDEVGPAVSSEPRVGTGVLNHLKLLIVDDSADTIDMLRRLLEMDGARVKSARSGAEALCVAGEEDFDVILSDISMPGMDGFEFLRRLRRIPGQKDVPVFALTGFGRAADIERAAREGFFTHVTKPIAAEPLIATLSRITPKKPQKEYAKQR